MKSTPKPEYHHIFGPVPSRRLGISLGVDLMPHKTCSLDCVYCECGKTTNLTITPDEYTPIDRIRHELNSFLASNPRLDYITFSGSGEPTLHNGIGEIIEYIKSDFPDYKVALLTNSTLFHLSEIRKRILDADIIIASLDAVSEKIFRAINRPHTGLDNKAIVEGIIALKKEYLNEFWIEVFIVPGFNDNLDEISLIQNFVDRIKPSQVHLNTLDRPGTEKWVEPASKNVLKKIHACMHNVQIIQHIDYSASAKKPSVDMLKFILTTLKRRPCTIEDLSKSTGANSEKVHQYLDILLKNGEVKSEKMPRGIFYKIHSKTPGKRDNSVM
jgi:wyosine [tRNA(Phe)-imidazoG37] synthetase (radical SAM superfamily)